MLWRVSAQIKASRSLQRQMWVLLWIRFVIYSALVSVYTSKRLLWLSKNSTGNEPNQRQAEERTHRQHLVQLPQREEKESQMEEEMHRQTWPLLITLLLNHSIIWRRNTRQLLLAPGQDWRRREIWKWRRARWRGCMFERNRERER